MQIIPTPATPEGRTPVGLRSGADAREHGKVEEYALAMKQRLLAGGRTEEEAEKARLEIIARWKVDGVRADA